MLLGSGRLHGSPARSVRHADAGMEMAAGIVHRPAPGFRSVLSGMSDESREETFELN